MTTPTTTIPQFDLAEIEVMMEALPKWAEAGAEGEFQAKLIGIADHLRAAQMVEGALR